jgi:hypothetical protein
VAVKRRTIASECHAKKYVSGQPIIIKIPVLRTRIVADLKQVKSSLPMKKVSAKAGCRTSQKRPAMGGRSANITIYSHQKDAQMQSSQNRGSLPSINSVP